MAKATFAISAAAEWTLIAAGADYQSVYLYDRYPEQFAIAIASDTPDADSNDYFKLPYEGVTITLGTGDKLYCKAMNGTVMVRGYRDEVGG